MSDGVPSALKRRKVTALRRRNLGGTTDDFRPMSGWRSIFLYFGLFLILKGDRFMQWTGLNELREKYLAFFESKETLSLSHETGWIVI